VHFKIVLEPNYVGHVEIESRHTLVRREVDFEVVFKSHIVNIFKLCNNVYTFLDDFIL